MYIERGDEIFPPVGDGAHRFVQRVGQWVTRLFRYRYNRAALDALLLEALGERKFGESLTRLWCARLTGEGQPVEVRRKEGVTNHFRPESCAGRCEAAGEALTGARTGRAIEHRKRERLERRDCHSGRRQHRHHRNGEGMAGSTVSENPCTFVRPSSGPGRSSFRPGSRTGAAAGRRIPYPMMHGMKKSDEAIVCARQRTGQEG